MRTLAMVSLMALSACASSHIAPSRPAMETVRVMGTGGGSLTMTSNSVPIRVNVPVALEDAWRVLPAAYDSLGIPITTIDPKTHVVANEGMKVRNQLGKTPLSRYVDCGTTQIGPNADTYDIYLIVVTQLQAGAPGAIFVTTNVEAAGRPIAFPGDYSRCRSKGVLEARLADVVKARAWR